MKSRLLIAFATASLAFAFTAQAGNEPAKFEELDKNHDGKISLNEAAEHDGLFVAFKELDKDKDGQLTREEFAAYSKK